MGEKRRDSLLGIRTVGLREWSGHSDYNRYEATPYVALDALFQAYRFKKGDQVVDFGCGRGRVAFAIHNRFHVPVIGIEAHELTLQEAWDNEYTYSQKAKHITAPIRFKYGLAQHYQVKPEDNCFFFFNPFSEKIFKKVVTNILHSVRKHDRVTDIILYYPMPKYQEFLRNHTPFKIINKIKVPQLSEALEKFIIYRRQRSIRS